MFCPQCGIESNEGQHYCRSCGTNLKIIGKAVSFSDVIAKTDTVPPKVKQEVANVADKVSRAMSKMNRAVARHSAERRQRWRREKTPQEKRERHLTRGFIKIGWGGGLSIFLFSIFRAVELHLPPDLIAEVPFAIDPVVRALWTIGLIPMLSGVGHVIAGLMIKPTPAIAAAENQPLTIGAPDAGQQNDPELTRVTVREPPSSVTDRTTNILDRDVSWQNSKAIQLKG